MQLTHDSQFQTTDPSCYEIETIETLEALRDLEHEWKGFIEEGSTGANFFNDPRHIDIQLQKETGAVPWILILRRDGKLRCIAPFYFCRGQFLLQLSVIKLGSFAVRTAKVFGDDFIIAAGEDQAKCNAVVFEELWKQRSKFEAVRFECLISSTPLWDYCRARFAKDRRFRFSLASTQMEKIHHIHFPSTHEAFLSARSSRARQKQRYYTRKLCDTEHARLLRITTADQITGFLNQLDQVYRDSWQAKTFGYRPRNTDVETRYLTHMSDCGWLRSYLLENDSGPIAYVLGFQYGNAYHFLETGYVQAWSEFSPGIVLMYLLFEDLYRADLPQLLSFGVGDAGYKQSFSNVELEGAGVHLLLPNRWRFIASVQRGLNSLDRRLRSLLIFFKCDRVIRKLLKRQR